MESFRELLGEREPLWLLDLCKGRSGRGLDSLLLLGLEPSEPGFRLAGSPVVRRLVLGGMVTGIWYGLKRRRGRVLLRKGFRDRELAAAALVAGSAEAAAAAAAM